jgi:hypothetical protein
LSSKALENKRVMGEEEILDSFRAISEKSLVSFHHRYSMR